MDPKPRPNHKLYIEILRRMTVEQKLQKVFELSEMGKSLFRERVIPYAPSIRTPYSGQSA